MEVSNEHQKKILEFLLDQPEGITLDGISELLGITRTAVKNHITRLESLGLVGYRDEKGAVGRPSRKYILTDNGQEVFPRKYSWLSIEILSFLAKEQGESALESIMQKLAIEIAEKMKHRFIGINSSSELYSRITLILNELGYRAQLKQSDIRKDVIIEAVNCVYHTVAKSHPSVCQFDIKFIEVASGGQNVVLESCIAKGAKVCRFCISQKTS